MEDVSMEVSNPMNLTELPVVQLDQQEAINKAVNKIPDIRATLKLTPQEEISKVESERKLSMLTTVDQLLETNLEKDRKMHAGFYNQDLRNVLNIKDPSINVSPTIDIDKKINRPWYIRLDRRNLLKYLDKNHVEDGATKIKILENKPMSYLYYRSLIRQETINNLSGITPEQIKTGSERLVELNQNDVVETLVDPKRFPGEQSNEAKLNIIRVAEIPEDKWKKTKDKLNPYYFICSGKYNNDDAKQRSESNFLIDYITNGEVSDLTTNRLDYIQKFELIVTESPSELPYFPFCDTNPSSLLSEKQHLVEDDAKKMLELTKRLVHVAKSSGKFVQSRELYSNLELLKERGLLDITLATINANSDPSHRLEENLSNQDMTGLPVIEFDRGVEITEKDSEYLKLVFEIFKISPKIEDMGIYIDLIKHKSNILSVISQNPQDVEIGSSTTFLKGKVVETVMANPEDFGEEFLSLTINNCREFSSIDPQILLKKELSDRIFNVFKNNTATTRQALFQVFPPFSEESVKDLPKDEQEFWRFFGNLKEHEKDYFMFLGKDKFDEKYHPEGTTLNTEAYEKDSMMTVILKPELLQTWESLTEVFKSINRSVNSSELRGAAYLRISCALDSNTLTSRTEVEALNLLQTEFFSLYRLQDEIGPYEKQALTILRRHLPFSTDEAIRTELKAKAVEIGDSDLKSLDWVHQTIHNYVRSDNPEYVRNLRDWVKNGNEKSRDRVLELSTYYTPESRPSENFFTEENRTNFLKIMPLFNELSELTDKYFEVQPEKINQILQNYNFGSEDAKTSLGSEIFDVSTELTNDIKNNQIANFLVKTPSLREYIKNAAWKEGHMALYDIGLEQLDATVSTLYPKLLPVYLRSVETKMATNSFSQKDAVDLMHVFSATLKSGALEGDMPPVPQDILESIDSISEATGLTYAQFESILLRLAVYENTSQNHWNEFTELARTEMIDMLKRKGVDERTAISRVTMTDLVNYEKSSYKFMIDPMFDLINKNGDVIKKSIGIAKEGEIFFNLPEQDITVKGPENPIVKNFLDNLSKNNTLPIDAKSAGEYIASLDSLQEFKADQLCAYVIPEYASRSLDPKEWGKYTKTTLGKDKIEIYPFTLYGGNGVVVLRNGKIADDPLQLIMEAYQSNIVPAMLNAIKLN